MAHTDDFGAADERARIEQDAHEAPTTSRDPARPGNRSGLSVALWGVLFLFVVALFFYVLSEG